MKTRYLQIPISQLQLGQHVHDELSAQTRAASRQLLRAGVGTPRSISPRGRGMRCDLGATPPIHVRAFCLIIVAALTISVVAFSRRVASNLASYSTANAFHRFDLLLSFRFFTFNDLSSSLDAARDLRGTSEELPSTAARASALTGDQAERLQRIGQRGYA